MNSPHVKIKKLSRPLFIIFVIICIDVLIDIIIKSVAMILLLVTGSGTLEQSIGSWKVFHFFIPQQATISGGELIGYLTGELLRQGFLLVLFGLALLVFRDISRTGTPFTKKNANRLEGIAVLFLAALLLPPLITMLITMILVPDIDTSANIPVTYILFTVIFYALAKIFDYGRLLQEESDETL